MLASDISTTSTTLVNATGLSFAVAANTRYIFEADVIWSSNSLTEGVGISFSGPASPTLIVWDFRSFSALTTLRSRMGRAWDDGSTAITAVDSINANVPGRVNGVFVNGANAGTFTMRYLAGTGVTATIKAGSMLRYRLVP